MMPLKRPGEELTNEGKMQRTEEGEEESLQETENQDHHTEGPPTFDPAHASLYGPPPPGPPPDDLKPSTSQMPVKERAEIEARFIGLKKELIEARQETKKTEQRLDKLNAEFLKATTDIQALRTNMISKDVKQQAEFNKLNTITAELRALFEGQSKELEKLRQGSAPPQPAAQWQQPEAPQQAQPQYPPQQAYPPAAYQQYYQPQPPTPAPAPAQHTPQYQPQQYQQPQASQPAAPAATPAQAYQHPQYASYQQHYAQPAPTPTPTPAPTQYAQQPYQHQPQAPQQAAYAAHYAAQVAASATGQNPQAPVGAEPSAGDPLYANNAYSGFGSSTAPAAAARPWG